MELKTKYNIGDEVYYIVYNYKSYIICKKCGARKYKRKPCGIESGTIKEVNVQIGSFVTDEDNYIHIEYQVTDGYEVTTVCEEDIYTTIKMAEEAIEKEKENDA